MTDLIGRPHNDCDDVACQACATGDCQACLNVYDDTIPCNCNHTPALAAPVKYVVECPAAAIEDVVLWWRSANEAPGGCSSFDAIKGMSDSIGILLKALREQVPNAP
jgi:hypothetical protein